MQISLKNTFAVVEPEVTVQFSESISLVSGYRFKNGLTADLGFRFAEEANIDTHVIGVLFTYELEVAYQ